MRPIPLHTSTTAFFLGTLITIPALSAAELHWTLKPGEAASTRAELVFPSSKSRIELTIAHADQIARLLRLTPSGKGERLVVRLIDPRVSDPEEATSQQSLTFRPTDKAVTALLEEDGVNPQGCLSRPLVLRVDASDAQLNLWLEGQIIASIPWEKATNTDIRISPKGGAEARQKWTHDESKTAGRYEMIELPELARQGEAAPERVEIGGIPFNVWDKGSKRLSLKQAGWPDWKRDPAGFNQAYDGGPYFIGDPRMPSTQLPNAAFSHAYVLARVAPDPEGTNRFTLRLGRRIGGYTERSQVLTRDFVAEVPESDKGAAYEGLHLIRIPLGDLFPSLVEGEILDLELTKEVRLARRSPDPNSFRWRPLGPASNVEIAALTFVRSPITMELSFPHAGKLFEKGEAPEATIRVHNTTRQPGDYRLHVGAGDKEEITGTLQPGETKEHKITPAQTAPGVHPLRVVLTDGNGEPLLEHGTTYAIIPPLERQHLATSPFGIGGAGGGKHFTPLNADATAGMAARLGFRYLGSLGIPYEARKKQGLQQGIVLSMRPGNGGSQAILKRWKERLAEHPDQPRQLLIFHEDGISGGHAARVPDLFTDRPPYPLNEEEKTRFDKMVHEAVETGKIFRQHHPDVEIQLGNGNIVVREEFYRQKFPAGLFDTAGNENPTFSRLPETQPPDAIGNNSSLWMDRQLLDHYGYEKKKVTQCHETIYPSANPGNLSHRTQADYLVRHYLHSLAWGIEQIRGSSLLDKGNSYKNSNWGRTGLFTARPDLSPKPAAVRMATLTWVLDGARYDGFFDTGSDSLYVMRFLLPEESGTLLPYWTVRGPRTVSLEIEGASTVTHLSPDGEEKELPITGGSVTLTATSAAAYVKLPKAARVTKVSPGDSAEPAGYAGPGKATKVGSLATSDGWHVAQKKHALLEFYNPLAPRRLGNFEIGLSAPESEGRGALKVAPLPMEGGKPTMPMYRELQAATPIPLPGEPTDLAIRVKGNSGWGRVILELRDASGQQWLSIGARSKRGGSPWMADWLGKELAERYEPGERADWNTDDAWGHSRINFDGWRHVSIPLPGQYPGEGYPWPANSQWRWDKDGKVHYPLVLTGVVIELQEKVLHLTRYAPPRKAEIYLDTIVSISNPARYPAKEAPEEIIGAYQITID